MSLPILHLVPLAVALVWAAVSDLRSRRIPNAVTVVVLVGGLAVRGLDGGLSAALSGLAAAAIVLAALYLPWRAGGLKGGDVKLAAAVGAWVGLGKLVWFALATAVGGGMVSLACYFLTPASVRAEVRSNLTLALLQGELPSVSTQRPGRVSVPYATAIAAGAAIAFFVA